MARPTDIVFMRFKSAGFADLRRPILAGVGLALGMSAAAPALAAVDGQAAEPQQPTTVASSRTPLEGPTPVAEPAGLGLQFPRGPTGGRLVGTEEAGLSSQDVQPQGPRGR